MSAPPEALRYGPFARLSDWWHGVRDGLVGIPGRPPQAPPPSADDGRPEALRAVPAWRVATTPHREYLIRTANDAFAKEYVWYAATKTTRAQGLAQVQAERDALRAALGEAEAEWARVSQPLTEEEATRRGIGETHHPERVIRRRREREWQRRVTEAKQHCTAVRARHNRVAALATAAEEEARNHDAVTKGRIERIHQFFERRIASYRRPLVRLHPDGAWVNHVIGVNDPSIPGWIPNGIRPDLAPDPREYLSEEEEDEAAPPDPIRLAQVTSFGTAPERIDALGRHDHVHVDHYWAAERHFELRRGDGLVTLEVFVGQHGPYVGEAQAKGTLRLVDGAEFEFDGVVYRLVVTEQAAELHRRDGPGDLIVHNVSATTDGTPRLTHMTVVQPLGSVMAILGPSGAGKTSLFHALVNELKPDEGEFFYRGHDVRTQAERFREDLGFVPQKEDMYQALTVRRILEYSDRLHKPSSRADRRRRVEEVCERLRVRDQLDQVARTLSGGQLKRVSIAMELLRRPRLLMLDEPTSGLDAGLDRDVMRRLRAYAAGREGGRSDKALVIVITHATTHLHLAHQLLVLAQGGRPVFSGPPRRLIRTLESARQRLTIDGKPLRSYADVMDLLSPGRRDAQLALADDYRDAGTETSRARREAEKARANARPHVEAAAVRAWRTATRFSRQFLIMTGRQIRLLVARGFGQNRGPRRIVENATGRPRLLRTVARVALRRVLAPMRTFMPLLIAAGGAGIVALVAEQEGLGPGPSALGALGLLTTVAIFAGQSLTYTDIVSEFPIIRRERRTGAITASVVLSKWVVFAVLATAQAAIITGVFTSLRPGPDFGNRFAPTTELFIDLAALTVTAMTLGLLISTARKFEQAVLVNAFVMIAEIALNGASMDFSDNRVGGTIAAVLPTRWGLAAAASSMDLTGVSPAAPRDALWTHSISQWATDLAWLGGLTAGFLALTFFRLLRRLSRPED